MALSQSGPLTSQRQAPAPTWTRSTPCCSGGPPRPRCLSCFPTPQSVQTGLLWGDPCLSSLLLALLRPQGPEACWAARFRCEHHSGVNTTQGGCRNLPTRLNCLHLPSMDGHDSLPCFLPCLLIALCNSLCLALSIFNRSSGGIGRQVVWALTRRRQGTFRPLAKAWWLVGDCLDALAS